MLNSDLLFTAFTAATAFGAAIILAPSAARTDSPPRIYAVQSPDLRNDTAGFARAETVDGVRKISTSQSDSELRPTDHRVAH
jgi:hypothetical protein